MKQKKSLLCYKSARKPNWVWGNIRLCGRCTRSAQLCAQSADNKVNWVTKFQKGYHKVVQSYRNFGNITVLWRIQHRMEGRFKNIRLCRHYTQSTQLFSQPADNKVNWVV